VRHIHSLSASRRITYGGNTLDDLSIDLDLRLVVVRRDSITFQHSWVTVDGDGEPRESCFCVVYALLPGAESAGGISTRRAYRIGPSRGAATKLLRRVVGFGTRRIRAAGLRYTVAAPEIVMP
jgi:hypothetical protein